MSEPIRTTDDEIDLIELIKMLWGGKWLITGLCMIGLIIAGGFLYIQNQHQRKSYSGS